MLSAISRLASLRRHASDGAVLALLTLTGALVGALPALANPNPQPSTASIPLSYNGDPDDANAQIVHCPMGPPGVTQNCTGQITVRAQPYSVGYLDWHMDGPPTLSGTNGSTFTYQTNAADTCHAVPSNPSGAEPDSGYCTLTHITFTPGAASTGAAETLTVSFTWTEQGPDTETGQVQYTPTNPLLTGTNTLSITTEGSAPAPPPTAGTAVVVSNPLLTCNGAYSSQSVVGQGTTNCGNYIIQANGGTVQIPADGSLFTTTDEGANSYLDNTGTCTPGLVLGAGQTCTTNSLIFNPTNALANSPTLYGIWNPYITLSFAGGQTITSVNAQALQAYGIADSPDPYTDVSSIACQPTAVGQTSDCGPIKLYDANVGLNTRVSFVTVTDTINFSITAGTCTFSNGLTNGAYCTTGDLMFHPTTPGTFASEVILKTNWPAVTVPVTGTGTGTITYGTLWLSPGNDLDCGSADVGTTLACTNGDGSTGLTLNAQGGPVLLSGAPIVVSQDNANFSIDVGTCLPGTLIPDGGSCTTGALSFSPTMSSVSQIYLGALTITDAQNNTLPVQLDGQGNYGTLALSVPEIDCGTVGVGVATPCGAPLTITATGGPGLISSLSVSGDGSFSLDLGSCQPGTLLVSGASCQTGVLMFAPITAASYNEYVTLIDGTNSEGSVMLTGTGIYGTLSITPTSIACGNVGVGVPTACGTGLTITAIGGPALMSSGLPLSVSGDGSFTLDPGTCQPGTPIAAGTSCTTGPLMFAPISAQSYSENISIADESDIVQSVPVTGSGVYGTLTIAPASIDCGSTGVGIAVPCASGLTITATGGPASMSTDLPLSVSGDGSFTLDAGTCQPGMALASGASCTTGILMFTPGSAQAYSENILIADESDTVQSVPVTGTGAYGALTLSTTAMNCGIVGMGFTEPCSGGVGITITATGGPVLLNATAPIATSPVNFSIDPGTCTPGTLLASGSTCLTGAVSFAPDAAQSFSGSVTVTDGQNLTASVSLTGTGILGWVSTTTGACTGGSGQWNYSAYSAATCANPTQTRTALCGIIVNSGAQPRTSACTGAAGAILDDSVCAQWAPKPAATQSCTPIDNSVCGTEDALTQTVPPSGCAYSWTPGGFGACTSSAASTWTYTAWAPASGCAMVTQTRTGTCTAGAGTQTQTVTCQSADGTVQPDALCAGSGTEPALSQSCTVTTPGTNCGTEAALSQSATLSDACGGTTGGTGGTGGVPPVNGPVTGSPTPGGPGGDGATSGYSWGSCTWGTCSGGTGSWVSSSWTPATGSNCTETLQQTRINTCTAASGSGTQACTATCQDSSGNAAPSSMCGSLPGGQTCTPTTVSCAGTAPATAQTVIDRGGCGPASWVQGGFGACVGGTGTWSYVTWTPATGCGMTTQTSTGTCIPLAGSGTQSQTVTCQAADGATLPSSGCTGAPAATQSCTPDTSICGAGGTSTRQQNLTDCAGGPATGTGPCVTNPALNQYCVIVPLPPQ